MKLSPVPYHFKFSLSSLGSYVLWTKSYLAHGKMSTKTPISLIEVSSFFKEVSIITFGSICVDPKHSCLNFSRNFQSQIICIAAFSCRSHFPHLQHQHLFNIPILNSCLLRRQCLSYRPITVLYLSHSDLEYPVNVVNESFCISIAASSVMPQEGCGPSTIVVPLLLIGLLFCSQKPLCDWAPRKGILCCSAPVC